MKAILTGDIVNSTDKGKSDWLKKLKSVLSTHGKSPKTWQIFRGDSFQIELEPESALYFALYLKSVIKQTGIQDVRIAIGIGDVNHGAKKITESNGEAFIYSGEAFDALKKDTLSILSSHPERDEVFNIMFKLMMFTANTWSNVVAEVITHALEHPEKNQKNLAQDLNKSQSNISAALKRGGYDEMMLALAYYKKQFNP